MLLTVVSAGLELIAERGGRGSSSGRGRAVVSDTTIKDSGVAGTSAIKHAILTEVTLLEAEGGGHRTGVCDW